MLEFFHPPNLNQQPELMQGHPDNISTTMSCHERTGKFTTFVWPHLVYLYQSIQSYGHHISWCAIEMTRIFRNESLGYNKDLIDFGKEKRLFIHISLERWSWHHWLIDEFLAVHCGARLKQNICMLLSF